MKRIQYNEQQVNKNLRDLTNLLNKIESKNKTIRVKQIILNMKQIFLQIALITDNLLMTLQSAILLAKRQLLHPVVLNTKLIKKALLSFKIPPSRILPILIYPDSPNDAQYNNFCIIETEIHYNNLLFSITVPLIENNNYTQYELIPFPFANKYPSYELFTIIPSHPILLFSQQSSTFSLTNELINCIQTTPQFKICTLHHVQSTMTGPCEIGLLLEDSTQCQNEHRLQTIKATAESWHYIKNNQWLFVLNKPGSISIRCTNQNLHLQLPNVGILTLLDTCTAQSKEYTFFPHKKYVSTETQFHFIPRFNFTKILPEIEDISFIKPATLKNFDSTQLQSIIDRQQEEIQDFNDSIEQKNQSHSYRYIGIAIIILITFTILYMCIKERRKEHYVKQVPAISFAINENLTEETIPEPQSLRRSTRLKKLRD